MQLHKGHACPCTQHSTILILLYSWPGIPSKYWCPKHSLIMDRKGDIKFIVIYKTVEIGTHTDIHYKLQSVTTKILLQLCLCRSTSVIPSRRIPCHPFSLLILHVRHIGATNGVPEGEKRSVIPNIVCVVIIVNICTGSKRKVPKWHKPKVIPTMSVYAFQQAQHKPHPHGVDIALQQEGTQKERNGIAKSVLYGVKVFCREPRWLVVAVVELVEAFVEERRVEEAMDPVECSVFDAEKERNL